MRFSSKRVDEETGFIYFGRRYYDPTLGKWLTQDPLGLKAGPNLYAYVVNNPMTTFDLYGLLAVEFEKMNQLSGSSGYRNDAAGYSCYDKTSHDRYEARMKTTSREGLPFLASTDHNSNTSPSGNDLWDKICDATPELLSNGLDALDKLSYAAMLVPLPQVRVAGLGIYTISTLAKLMLRPQVGKGIIKPIQHLIRTNALNKQSVSAIKSLAKKELASGHAEDYVNIASDSRTQHILYGDTSGGGHLWPARTDKTPFPSSWSSDKIMDAVSDVATDPSIMWNPTRSSKGQIRFKAIGERDGIKIKVIVEPHGEGIITGYPTK